MGFTCELLDKSAAVEAVKAKVSEVPEKLLSAVEPKVVVLTYTLPLSSVGKSQLDQFEKQPFLRDSLRHQKGHIKYSKDNPRILPANAELARVEDREKVTVYYHGRTGILHAIDVSNVTVANPSDLPATSQLLDDYAKQVSASLAPPKASRGKGRGE
jgi:hypothetical protein